MIEVNSDLASFSNVAKVKMQQSVIKNQQSSVQFRANQVSRDRQGCTLIHGDGHVLSNARGVFDEEGGAFKDS